MNPSAPRLRRSVATPFASLAILTFFLPAVAMAVCAGDVYDEFGPMVGTWDLRADGQTIGSVDVQSDDGGCSLLRTFRIGPTSVRSILFVDPADGKLNEVVIDQDGGVFRLAGTKQDGQWMLQGTFTDGDGNGTGARVSIESLAAGGFRETLDIENESEWGRVFDFRFGTQQARPSDPPTRTTSASTPARSSSAPTRTAATSPAPATPMPPVQPEPERIRVSSGAEGPSSMRGQAVSKIVVDSPMLVDLQLGPIDKLPDGYAWSSKDLARYEIDGATIENVEVRRRTRRGRSTLVVTLFGSSPKFTDEFDVSIEVVDTEGNSLSDVGEGRLYVGRSVGQQIEEGATSLKIELSTRTEELNAALASGERPKLAIKIVARD